MEKEIRRLDEHESKENTRRRWKEQGRNCLLLGISGPDFSQTGWNKADEQYCPPKQREIKYHI
uniref:Uncharacterized protein n=1 Tax=Daucus carota subsp. sativus TaxID=79200 RepID=A0A175YAF9_DAUCS